MLIGLSFGKCLRDLVEKKVELSEVLVICSGTNFNPNNDEQWNSVWTGYRTKNGWSPTYWIDVNEKQEAIYREVACALLSSGVLHQPKQFGGFPQKSIYHWHLLVPVPDNISLHPTVKKSYDHYKANLELSGIFIKK